MLDSFAGDSSSGEDWTSAVNVDGAGDARISVRRSAERKRHAMRFPVQDL